MYLTENKGFRNKTSLRTFLQNDLNNNKFVLQLKALGILENCSLDLGCISYILVKL